MVNIRIIIMNKKTHRNLYSMILNVNEARRGMATRTIEFAICVPSCSLYCLCQGWKEGNKSRMAWSATLGVEQKNKRVKRLWGIATTPLVRSSVEQKWPWFWDMILLSRSRSFATRLPSTTSSPAVCAKDDNAFWETQNLLVLFSFRFQIPYLFQHTCPCLFRERNVLDQKKGAV